MIEEEIVACDINCPVNPSGLSLIESWRLRNVTVLSKKSCTLTNELSKRSCALTNGYNFWPSGKRSILTVKSFNLVEVINL